MDRSGIVDDTCRELREENRFRTDNRGENGTAELVGTEETSENLEGKREGLNSTPTLRVNGTMMVSSKL